MPSLTRRRPTSSRYRAPIAALLIAGLVAACSATPVSNVSTAPETAPPASVPASVAPTTAPASDGPTSAPPTATPTPPLAEPGKPTGTTYELVSKQPLDGGGRRETHRITWKAPAGQATAFLVYGVKDCLRAQKKFNGKPCVIRGMPIPRDSLALLAQAPGAARSIDVTWQVPKSGRQPYAAVLIRATNPAGDSIFTIVHSENVCVRC
jgi:hypothetical protein